MADSKEIIRNFYSNLFPDDCLFHFACHRFSILSFALLSPTAILPRLFPSSIIFSLYSIPHLPIAAPMTAIFYCPLFFVQTTETSQCTGDSSRWSYCLRGKYDCKEKWNKTVAISRFIIQRRLHDDNDTFNSIFRWENLTRGSERGHFRERHLNNWNVSL